MSDITTQFPTNDDFNRVAKLNNYYNVFKGLHSKVFKLKSYFEEDSKKKTLLYLAYNVGQIVSLTAADFLFGEQLKIQTNESEDQKPMEKKINTIIQNNYLDEKLYQSAVMQDVAGFAIITVRQKDKAAIIEEVPYDNYYPDFTGVRLGEEPRQIVIASYVDLVNPKNQKKETFLYKQIHKLENSKGKIVHELWTTTPDMKQSQLTELALFSADLPAEEDTELDYIPIFQIDNFKTVKERFGISTYESVMNLFEEINDRITQISVQLIKHLNSKVAVGEGVLSKKGEIDSTQDIFLVEKGDIIPQYITNSNPLIEEGFKQIEGLIRQICTVTQTPASFLGLDDKGGVEKVETAKLRMASFLKKIKRKQRSYEAKLVDILKTALFFEGAKKFPDNVDISFAWDLGLPRDLFTEAQTHQIMVESGMESKETAIRELKGFDGETLQNELDKIEKQNEMSTYQIDQARKQIPDISL
ncbi:phage portal protein [Candidatus Uhrbacteria bacterium]|nr:phage portal protein [Candidatus Uhrbacteria bacterium]